MTGKPEAVVAVLMDDNRVLVIQRGPEASWSGYWAPLSGRLEPGESQAEALVREVREEIGIDVRPTAKVWECETDDGRYVLHWWTAAVEPGQDELVLDPGEVSAVRWVTPAEYGELAPTFPGDRAFFTEVLPGLRSS